jgi:hypothetical protein
MYTCETAEQPRGAALVIVMLVMAVLLLAGTTFLTISSTESQIAENQYASARAFLVAEAGLHRAVAQLSGNAAYPGEASVPMGAGTAGITVSAAAQQVCLSKDVVVSASVPVRGGYAQTRLRATADQAIYPFQWGFFAANGPLILSSLDGSQAPWSRVDSYDSRLGPYDLVTNGGGSANVAARGDGVILNHVNVLGGVAANWVSSSPTPVPNLGRPGDAPPALPEPSAVWSNDPNVEPGGTLTLPSGTHYYTTLTLGAGAQVLASGGPVTVYVRGAFQVADDVTMGAEPGEKLSLITNSGTGTPAEFRSGQNLRLFGSLFGTNTSVLLGDSAVIHGSIIGRRISGTQLSWAGQPCCNQKAPTLHFDRAMTARPICTYSTFGIRRGTWREIVP